MASDKNSAEFDRTFLPHMDAAYNLARILMRNAEDAEDVVQESYLKALRGFSSFRGEGSRPWLLAIVRNTAFTWLRNNRSRGGDTEYREDLHVSGEANPEAQSIYGERKRAVEHCVDQLPAEFREAFILREVEELTYREIATVTGVPFGTVMSRLARARARLAGCLKLGGRIGL